MAGWWGGGVEARSLADPLADPLADLPSPSSTWKSRSRPRWERRRACEEVRMRWWRERCLRWRDAFPAVVSLLSTTLSTLVSVDSTPPSRNGDPPRR